MEHKDIPVESLLNYLEDIKKEKPYEDEVAQTYSPEQISVINDIIHDVRVYRGTGCFRL